jgi:hypothetical protein
LLELFSTNFIDFKIGLTSLRFEWNARNPFTVLAKVTKAILIQKLQTAQTMEMDKGYSGTGQYPIQEFWWKHEFNILITSNE